MRTTTEDRGLVRRLEEPAPEPGHDVIVFEPVGGGRRYKTAFGPDETYRPPITERLLHRDRKPIAYAVSRNRHLHTFSRSMPTVNDIGLPVRATLEVSVTDAKWVAENLDLDPLRRLEDEVAMRCAKIVKGLDLKELDGNKVDPDRLVLDHPVDDEQGCRTTCGEALVAFAPRQGLTLHRISLEWTLPDAWTTRTNAVIKVELEAEVDTRREQLGHDMRQLKEQNAHLEATLRSERERFQEGERLNNEYRRALAAKVIETIGSQNPSNVANMVRELEALDRQLRVLRQPSLAALPENGSRSSEVDGEDLAGVLGDLVRLAADDHYEARVRRRLLAAGLRAIAAAVDDGGDPDDETSTADGAPGKTLRRLLQDLARDKTLASNEHRQLLQRLADPRKLRELEWAGLRDDV